MKHDNNLLYTDLITPDANRSWHYPRRQQDTHSGQRHKKGYMDIRKLETPYTPSCCWDYYDTPTKCSAIKLSNTIKHNIQINKKRSIANGR